MTVGVEANRLCYCKCESQPLTSLAPASTVDWFLMDVTSPSFSLPSLPPSISSLAVFVFLGPRQLSSLAPLLWKLARSGARIATYGSHPTTPLDVTVTKHDVDGDLRVYSLKPSPVEPSVPLPKEKATLHPTRRLRAKSAAPHRGRREKAVSA